MNYIFGLLVILTLVLSFSANNKALANPQTDAQSSSQIDLSKINIPLLENESILDGQISPNEYKGAAELELAFITRPFEDLPAPVKTEVKVFENGTDLFVAFIASDPNPELIRAFLRDRDAGLSDDLVSVKIDPFNDGRLAYQFFSNPLGVQGDSIENEMTGRESQSWNGIWESAGQLTDTGYIVEFKIPLRLMNFEESNAVKTWAIEFVRFYPRSDRYRLSHVPFDRDNACGLCQMGEAEGFKTAKQENNLAIVPTLVLGQNQQRDPAETVEWDENDTQEVGVDINWGITPEITLTGTLNPDFSQVESDQGQLNINRSFALFFSERRPFFVENADYFTSLQNLIYTRNINAPDFGAKVTGRIDNHSIGFFIANDDSTGFLVPGNLGSSVAQLEEKSVNMASRYRYDYSDDLSIGVLASLRSSDSYQNLVSSVDVRYRLSQSDTLRAQIAISDTEYPDFLQSSFCDDEDCSEDINKTEASLRTQDSTGIRGSSSRFIYNRSTDNYFVNASQTYTTSDFRADLGFISVVDLQKSVVGGGYFWRTDDSWWNQIRVNADWDITSNEDGELTEKEWEGYASIRGDYQTSFELGVVTRDRVGLRLDKSNLAIEGNTTRFDELSHSMFFSTSPNPTVSFRMFARKGDRVDLTHNRLGDQTYFEHRVTLNLGKHWRLDLETTRSRLDVENEPLFDADLYDLRSTYQFDPRQFVRLIVNYSDVKRNQAQYTNDVDARSRNVGVQFLYSYKLNPLTKFFVGYSQGARDNDELQSLKTDNQSVFMKFSYAWLPSF